jgi:uncharacterized protein
MSSRSLRLLPFNFRRMPSGSVLLANMAGQYCEMRSSDFEDLLADRVAPDCDLGRWLVSRLMAYEHAVDTAVELTATQLRTRKAYMYDFTALHMVVLTTACNSNCNYCHASSVDPTIGQAMSKQTAVRVVETIMASPSRHIKIEFQGGEPTLNWEVLTFITEYAIRMNRRHQKYLGFVLCTNLTSISRQQLDYLKKHNFDISTSLDGPCALHDTHRVLRAGGSAYSVFRENLELAFVACTKQRVSALSTITRANLHELAAVIDEYQALGFKGVFLRPVNQHGNALSDWSALSYSADEYVQAYKKALAYIIDLNIKGRYFQEYYARLLLARILTPFSTGFVDLQSPTGAGISGAIYDFDGSVYPADEGRMLARKDDHRFLLGNVHRDSYQELFHGAKLMDLVSHACVEVLPGCAYCAYSQYCGVDPIRYYVECGDPVGNRPTSEFCRKQIAIFDHLFSLLTEADPDVMAVFWSWLTGRPFQEVRL